VNNVPVILGVDVGTKTGLGLIGLDGELTFRQTLTFTRGYQAEELFNALRGILDPGIVVAWEQPFGKFAQDVLQRMVGAVLCACAYANCKNMPIHLVTNKRFATGNARADKAMMIGAAAGRWGGEGWDEHQADACWVAACARWHLENKIIEGGDDETKAISMGGAGGA